MFHTLLFTFGTFYILHPALSQGTPCTSLFALHTPNSALYTVNFAVHTLYTLHFAFGRSHSTLHTPHSEFTWGAPQYISNSTLHTSQSALYT